MGPLLELERLALRGCTLRAPGAAGRRRVDESAALVGSTTAPWRLMNEGVLDGRSPARLRAIDRLRNRSQLAWTRLPRPREVA